MESLSCNPANALNDLEFFDLDPSYVAMVLRQAEVNTSFTSDQSLNFEDVMQMIGSNSQPFEVEILPLTKYSNPMSSTSMYNQSLSSQPNMDGLSPYASPNHMYTFQDKNANVLEQNFDYSCDRVRTHSCPSDYLTMAGLEASMTAGLTPTSSYSTPLNTHAIPSGKFCNSPNFYCSGSHPYSCTRRFSSSGSSLINTPPDSPDMDVSNGHSTRLIGISDAHVDVQHKANSSYESSSVSGVRLNKDNVFVGEKRLRRRRSQLSLPFVCFICRKSYQEFRSLQHHSNLSHEIKISKAMYKLSSPGQKNV